jgi:hypothetical protein
LRFKLPFLVGGDDLRTTEAGYPARQQGACHGVGCDVRDGDDFRPADETVDCSEQYVYPADFGRGPTRSTWT